MLTWKLVFASRDWVLVMMVVASLFWSSLRTPFPNILLSSAITTPYTSL